MSLKFFKGDLGKKQPFTSSGKKKSILFKIPYAGYPITQLISEKKETKSNQTNTIIIIIISLYDNIIIKTSLYSSSLGPQNWKEGFRNSPFIPTPHKTSAKMAIATVLG